MPSSEPEEPRRSHLPYTSYPHILDLILHFSDYATLLTFRRTSSSLKYAVARELCRGPLVVDVDEPKNWEVGDGVIVFRTRRGVLPFLREEDWAWALARADAVEVDGWCLGPPRIGGPRGPRGPPPWDPDWDDRWKCVSACAYESDNDDSSCPYHGHYAALRADYLAFENALRTPCIDLEAIKRALSNIRREVPLTVLHSRDRPLPTHIPATDMLILRLDPMCDCAFEGRPESPPPSSPDYTSSYGPLHSATKVEVWVSPFLDDPVGDQGECICALAARTLLPSVRHLTIYAPSVPDSNANFSAMAEGPGPRFGGETYPDGTEVRHPELEVDLRLQVVHESERTRERVQAFSDYIGASPERFTFTHDPNAGDLPSLPPLKCGLLKL